jgi:hypothetical protein
MTWANDGELGLILRMEIREGVDLIPDTRRSLTEDQERVIAEAIVKHLEKGNWRIEPGSTERGARGSMGE